MKDKLKYQNSVHPFPKCPALPLPHNTPYVSSYVCFNPAHHWSSTSLIEHTYTTACVSCNAGGDNAEPVIYDQDVGLSTDGSQLVDKKWGACLA